MGTLANGSPSLGIRPENCNQHVAYVWNSQDREAGGAGNSELSDGGG